VEDSVTINSTPGSEAVKAVIGMSRLVEGVVTVNVETLGASVSAGALLWLAKCVTKTRLFLISTSEK
jgi:hypothetical protein